MNRKQAGVLFLCFHLNFDPCSFFIFVFHLRALCRSQEEGGGDEVNHALVQSRYSLCVNAPALVFSVCVVNRGKL